LHERTLAAITWATTEVHQDVLSKELRRLVRLVAVLAVLAAVGSRAKAADAPAGQVCAPTTTDDTLRPLPVALVPLAKRLFDLSKMPDAQIRRSTVFRCVDGKALLCTTGANLPCGKANVSRTLPAGTAWCKQHPESGAIPMSVTGHDTIYRWRCAGQSAEVVGVTATVDARGFIGRFWKSAD
jgi:hypothetical protein